jgi:hypothetical protein
MRDTIAIWSFAAFKFLAPVAWVAFLICLLILLPLSFVRRTGAWAAAVLLIASYLFGVTLWFASAAFTFSYFGWVGLIFGLVFAGIGVFPLALWAAFFGVGQAAIGWTLVAMFVVTIGARLLAFATVGRHSAT